MSCNIVPVEHIRTLVWAGLTFPPAGSRLSWIVPEADAAPSPDTITHAYGQHIRYLTKETAELTGQILLDANTRSVNHRYDEAEAYVYDHATAPATSWTPVEMLSALDGYEYQACEAPDWHLSEAHAFCDSLRRALIHCLPGYGDGPWEIGPDTRPHAVSGSVWR